MNLLRNLSINRRLWLILLLAVGLSLALYLVMLQLIDSGLRAGKAEKIQHSLETSHGSGRRLRRPRPGNRRTEVDRHPRRSHFRLQFPAQGARRILRERRRPGQIRAGLRIGLEQGDERRPF